MTIVFLNIPENITDEQIENMTPEELDQYREEQYPVDDDILLEDLEREEAEEAFQADMANEHLRDMASEVEWDL